MLESEVEISKFPRMSFTIAGMLLWLIPLLGYATHGFKQLSPVVSYVGAIYYHAGLHWLQSKSLYTNGFEFVYFPPSAAFLSVLSVFPLKIADVIFNYFSILLLAFGLYKFSFLAAKDSSAKNAGRYFFVMSLVAAPAVIDVVKIGEMHTLIVGLMLLALVALYDEKIWQAAILLSLSIAMKPTSLVLYLLMICVFPKLTFRMILSTLVIFLLPFVLQNPHYVLAQYLSCFHIFQTTSQYDLIHTTARWATIFSPIYQLGHVKVSGQLQYYLRLIFAVLTLGLCFMAKYKLSLKRALIYIMTFAMCYLMLFNSRTESSDYVMLMPFLGLFLMDMFVVREVLQRVFLIVLALCLEMGSDLSNALISGNRLWAKPAVATLFLVYVIYRLLVEVKSQLLISQDEAGLCSKRGD